MTFVKKNAGVGFTKSHKCEIDRKSWRDSAVLVYDVITYDQLYTYDFFEIETRSPNWK